MKKILIAIYLCCLYTACVSTEVDISSGLKGTIIEATSKQPIADCIVSMMPGNQSVSTDYAGNFDFGTVDMGEYTLSVSCNSYKRYNQPIVLKASEVLEMTIEMYEATLPEVNTLSCTDLADRTVTLTGMIESDGGIDLYEAGFYYGTTEKPNRKVLADVDGDNLRGYLSELSPSTRYYYRVYAKNELGETLGEIKTFVTEELQLSGVTTSDVSDITSTSALLSASIPEGEDLVETCGFYVWTYGKYPNKHKVIYSKSYSCEINNLTPGVRYYYTAFVANAKKENVGETKSFITTRLKQNGHEYANLGLPSGTLWATKNLGADSEYNAGDYFAWGELQSKTSFSEDNYKYITKTEKEKDGKIVYYYEFNKYTPYDNMTELLNSDDAANDILGGAWSIPSESQIKELQEKCIWELININNQNFYRIIGLNGAEILLPLTGYYRSISGQGFKKEDTYYWSNRIHSSAEAICLKLDVNAVSIPYLYKSSGAQIRPVL